jgi:hypothetical protein
MNTPDVDQRLACAQAKEGANVINAPRLAISLFLMLFFLGAVCAQDEKTQSRQSSVPIVTAVASTERVRFTAPSNVVRMQLQIISESGQILFDVSSKGNVLDWSLQDSSGQRLQGSYLAVVTVKSISGRLSERIGSVSVAEQQVELKAVEATGLTAAQQQAVGPIEESSALTILKGDEGQPITVVANDGKDGQIVRERGALSFRLGDFFSGNDKEQMRLTEEGNLGIGTAKPKARLDVAGMIRAREGFMFSDGSRLNLNDNGALTLTNSNGNVVPNVGGTGTQGRLAKWTDNAGTLGDSIVQEGANGTALQLTAPVSASVDTNILFLDSTSKTTGVIGGSQASFTASSGPFFAMRGNTYTAIGGGSQRGLFAIAAGDIPGATGRQGSILFNTGPDQVRMAIKPSGDVGIGTETPAARLDVAGNINTSTQYNIGGSPVLSVPGANNLFAGVGAGQSNTMGRSNSFFGTDAGKNNRADSNSFFGTQAGLVNTDGRFNSFFGHQAGIFNETGQDNSFFGAGAGAAHRTGGSNSFFGSVAGFNSDSGNNNIFIGAGSGSSNSVESNNTFIGTQANGVAGITNATALGYMAQVTQSNSVVLGSAGTNVGIGTTSPAEKLHVSGGNVRWANSQLITEQGGSLELGGTGSLAGTGTPYIDFHFGPVGAPQDFNTRIINDADGRLTVFGSVRLDTLNPLGPGSTALCLDNDNIISNCVSSIRFKDHVVTLRSGLDVVRKLRPVTFRWKDGGQKDIGLVAEEVSQVEPLLVTRTKNGEVQGVKYDRVAVVLLNAIKEQQQTIEHLKDQNVTLKASKAKQEARLAALESNVKRMMRTNGRQRRHQ